MSENGLEFLGGRIALPTQNEEAFNGGKNLKNRRCLSARRKGLREAMHKNRVRISFFFFKTYCVFFRSGLVIDFPAQHELRMWTESHITDHSVSIASD